MHILNLKLPEATWAALEARRQATGESIHHIVRAALAAHLELEHQTLYQVSTSTALVEGIYGGAVTVRQLREHGDFGLGTFDGLDGEMVVCDGHVFQVRSDGSAREAPDSGSTPFATVMHFRPESSFTLAGCPDLAGLLARIDEVRGSNNVFYAIRVDGAFPFVHTRAMCRTAEGVPLVVAAAHQPEFHMHDVTGTMVGFWSPPYVKTIEIPGHHLHFITAGRDAGGHVLDCAGRDLTVHMQEVRDLRVALPASNEFLKADLTHDPAADLERAELQSTKDLPPTT